MLFNHWMPATLKLQHILIRENGFAIGVRYGRRGKTLQTVQITEETADRQEGLLQIHHLFNQRLIHLPFPFFGFVGAGKYFLFTCYEFITGKALGIDESLFPIEGGRNSVRLRLGDFNIVAQDLVRGETERCNACFPPDLIQIRIQNSLAAALYRSEFIQFSIKA